MINNNYIYDKLPTEYRFFFHFVMPEIPVQYQQNIDNLIQAILLMIPHTDFNKKITLVISGVSQQYQIDKVHLSYSIAQPKLDMRVENFIFFNLDEIKLLPSQQQISHFLQQLIMAFMNIKNEAFAEKIMQLILSSSQT